MSTRAVTWVAKNSALTAEEMVHNAELAYRYLKNKGWSLQSIAATLANMEAESRINPGAWEGYIYGNMSGGYGLCQWTPATKYINWAGANWENNGQLQMDRLQYESLQGGEFWVKRHEDKSWTWDKFKASTESPQLLAVVFCWNFEGPWVVIAGSDEQKQELREYRGYLGQKWWTFVQRMESTPIKKRRRLPVWMMCRPHYK